MNIRSAYQTRPIRFVELYHINNWIVKIYSISLRREHVDTAFIDYAKQNLSHWLEQVTNYPLETYNIATLILHEGKEGCFAIINWWIDENMLQNHVYLSTYDEPQKFVLYSDKGIMTCVWELEVIWFERDAWIKHILMKNEKPDVESYLNEQLNLN